MMAAFHLDRRPEALARAAELLAALSPHDADVGVFIEYAYHTLEDEESLGLFQETVSRHSRAVGESVMSYADILEARGEARGEA